MTTDRPNEPVPEPMDPLTDEEIRLIGAAAMEVGAKLSAFTHAGGQLATMNGAITELATAVTQLKDVMATKEEVADVKKDLEHRTRRKLLWVVAALVILGSVALGNVLTIQAIRRGAHEESCAERTDTRAIIRGIAPQASDRLPPLEDCD